jgi:hypothetical protein
MAELATIAEIECECGNRAEPGDTECNWCAAARAEIEENGPHVGHWSTFGTYWCDTCNSPLCNLI